MKRLWVNDTTWVKIINKKTSKHVIWVQKQQYKCVNVWSGELKRSGQDKFIYQKILIQPLGQR